MDKHDKYEAVKQAWFEINEQLRNNKQEYIDYLKFSAKMYKQPYSDAVLVYQQNRNATKIAEYKKWGRLGRYVRRGSHGVAVFGKNHTCRYLYDVTQTGGKELPEMWTLTDRNTPELLNTLNNRYNISAGSIKECIEAMTANSLNSAPIAESVQNAISQMGLDTKQAEIYRHSLDSVVQFVVSQRCNLSGKIDLHADVDVSALDLIKNARDMILFSRAVQHAAKDTLFEIEKEVIAIDRKNEALDNAKTAKQESTSDRVDDILQDLIKLKFSQEQILALKQAVVAAAQNGEHNIRHWVSVRYSPDELRHISSLLSDYYAQSVIEQTLDPKGILNDYYTYVNELNGRLKLSDMFSHHEYSDEQKAMLQQGFSEGISITVLNEVDERLTVDEIKTFFEMFHQAVDGQIDPHDVQIYLDKAVIEHSKKNVQAVEVQDNSADTISADVTQQDKKIEPSRIIGLAENQLRPAVPNSSTSSITDSSGVVKSMQQENIEYKSNSVTQQDIDILRSIEPRKSVLNFTAEELQLTKDWAERFENDIHQKSPFYRAVNGEWRDQDEDRVSVLKLSQSNSTFETVSNDIKSQKIQRGTVKNNDTQWGIQISRRGLEDSISYARRHTDTKTYSLMYHLNEIISNGVLLDSVTTEKNNNNKANNSAFMHKFYNACKIDDEPCLVKITVEEFADGKGNTLKRMYNVQDIKTEPIRHAAFTDKQLALSVLNGSDISISELFKVVKHYDNDFYINHSEQKSQAMFERWGEQYSELTNNLDSNIIIHQSRNIVKSKKQENSADISSNDVKTSAALSEPTITCEWSESNYFEDGKTYSVAEFDTLMEQADSEMVAGAKAAIEKYGSAKAWYEADADDEFSQFMGYDKVKFTINMPDGQTITERQDAGDGYGGVIDFLKRYSIYSSIIPELEAAKAAHMADLVDEVPTPTNETQPEIDKLLGRLKLDCDYYLKTGAEKHLWAETVEKQIAKINELYEKMPENAYFTREQIDDYEKKMLAIKNGEVEKPIPYETPTIADNVLSEEKKTTLPVSESVPISSTSDEQISLFETPQEDIKTEKVEKPKKNVKASTYHFDPDNVVVGGAAARCDANIAAIETLLKIESEKRLATPEEQKIMARYSGWGGAAQAFVADNENVSADSWGARQTRLRELLTTDEYSAARSSTLTSFYTPPEVIDSVYLALERFQFEGGNILEPSMGVGNFFAKMPDEMRADSKLYGVELDGISGRIAKQLYPEDNIQIKGFEKTTFKNNSFDVVIGNIPFGDYGIADKAYDKYHFKIHDYFAAKAVDKVKPGGIVAIVTSKFTMDKKNDKARKYLANAVTF